MTIPNPLVLTYNAVAKNLPRINQDNYGSEYFLNDGTLTFRVKIRHSLEGAQKDGSTFERHNVELTVTRLATPTVPQSVVQIYDVVRDVSSLSTSAEVGLATSAFTALTTSGFFADLYQWVN